VSYDATGSGTGIEAVANGTCDIGLSSRALKDEETAKGLLWAPPSPWTASLS
jgi:phosphate transport system substrate-binding protein